MIAEDVFRPVWIDPAMLPDADRAAIARYRACERARLADGPEIAADRELYLAARRVQDQLDRVQEGILAAAAGAPVRSLHDVVARLALWHVARVETGEPGDLDPSDLVVIAAYRGLAALLSPGR